MKLAFIFAMPEELAALQLELEPLSNELFISPHVKIQGFTSVPFRDNCFFFVCEPTLQNVARIGSIPAALVTQKVIETLKPDLVVSAGTAGGFKRRGAEVGKIFLSSDIRFHDRRIDFSPFKESFSEKFKYHYNTQEIAQRLGLERGIVSTGDSFDKSPIDLEIIEKNQASLVEMEAAGVASVCEMHTQSNFALKAITNLIDEDQGSSSKKFQENFHLACSNLGNQIDRLSRFLLRSHKS